MVERLPVNVLDAVRVPVLMLDDRLRVVHLNRQAHALLPHAWALTGKRLDEAELPEPFRTAAELAADSAGTDCRRSVRDSKRRRIWDVRVQRLDAPLDGGPSVVVCMHDVTRTTELEDTLARGDRLAALGALTAGVAHEVRNPLFAISATLDAFADDAEHARLVSALRREVDRLALLVRELLEYGRAEAPTRVPTVLTELASGAIEATSLLATARGVQVVLTAPGCVQAPVDRERIALVFRNVVENAVHHSPVGAVVEIVIGDSIDDEGEWADVVVLDRGPGFPPDALDRVFVPFFTRRPGGTGLGLALVQRIVQVHGGRVGAHQRAGGGAIVAFSLPLRNRESASFPAGE